METEVPKGLYDRQNGVEFRRSWKLGKVVDKLVNWALQTFLLVGL